MPEPTNEENLMAAYASGDSAAFDALFNLLAPRLLAFFQSCLPEPCLAEELLQRTFVRLHEARAAYRPGTRLRPWLYAIAAQVGRAALHEPRTRARAAAAESGRPADAMRAAWGSLPCSQRLVIYLHRFEALSFTEIAQVLGSEEEAIRARAVRSYGALRASLQAAVGAGDMP
jgi:RNA polymerase sigma-70 factor (ECF subfamily)